MQPCRSCFSVRQLILYIFSLLMTFIALSAQAGQYTVGDKIEPISLKDQHAKSHIVDASAEVILFSRDMKGSDLLKQGLTDVGPEYLIGKKAVYIADISRMPKLIAKMIAIPAMRERPYSMLLDRDGKTTAHFPCMEDQATLIFLDQLTVRRIVNVTNALAVKQELEGTTDVKN